MTEETAWENLSWMWRGTAMEALGVTLEAINEEGIVLAMAITDAARQPFGLLHGGISLLLAESAASCHACWGVDLRARVPVGIEVSGSHLNAVREGRVRAEGRVLRRSQRLIVHQVEIVHEQSGALLCVARVTNYYKSLRPSAGTEAAQP